MTQDEFNSFCAALPHTHHVVQWGDADVWKVGAAETKKNKVFCVGGWRAQELEPQEVRSAQGATRKQKSFCVSFYCSEIAFEMLKDTPGCRPAPYLASRGMTWIQRFSDAGVTDTDLKDYIENSHRLMSRKLTKKLQRELGFIE